MHLYHWYACLNMSHSVVPLFLNTHSSDKLLTCFVPTTVHPVLVALPTALNVTLIEGNIIQSCNATGFPLPSIQWYQNGTLVTEDDRTSISNLTDSRSVLSTLTVSVAMTNDSGEYHCNASNTVGSVVSDTVTVFVQGVCMCTHLCMHVCAHLQEIQL